MSWPLRHLKSLGWLPYVHLVWLVFLIFQPIFDPGTTLLDWVLVPVMILAFLPLYIWSWTCRNNRQAIAAVAAMAALGLLCVGLNSGASSFFIYASAAAGFIGPPRLAMTIVGGLTALMVAVALVFGALTGWVTLLFFLPVILMVAVIGGVNIIEAENDRSNAKLRLAHEEIERLAKLAERERIARDLHDLLGHTLSLITLKAELAARLAESQPERAAVEIREVEGISRKALAEVRAAVRGYRSQGLASELANARLALEAAGIVLVDQMDPVEATPAQESVLSLALREAVTNVVRHAAATRCTVSLRRWGRWLVLEVADDGQGGLSPEGAGLLGMRERVEAQGGRLEREGGAGTRLKVVLPAGSAHRAPRAPSAPSQEGA